MIVRGVNVFPDADRGTAAQAAHSRASLSDRADQGRSARRFDAKRRNRVPKPRPTLPRSIWPKQALAYDIKALIGVSAVVNVLAVNGIERSVGKARRVVDKRKSRVVRPGRSCRRPANGAHASARTLSGSQWPSCH